MARSKPSFVGLRFLVFLDKFRPTCICIRSEGRYSISLKLVEVLFAFLSALRTCNQLVSESDIATWNKPRRTKHVVKDAKCASRVKSGSSLGCFGEFDVDSHRTEEALFASPADR